MSIKTNLFKSISWKPNFDPEKDSMNMETNSEKELFSLLEPVEACLNDYDKARLWTRIKKDALRMRALRRTAIIAQYIGCRNDYRRGNLFLRSEARL